MGEAELTKLFKKNNLLFQNKTKQFKVELSDLVKCVMCILETRVHMTFCLLTKEYTVPGNQDTHMTSFTRSK